MRAKCEGKVCRVTCLWCTCGVRGRAVVYVGGQSVRAVVYVGGQSVRAKCAGSHVFGVGGYVLCFCGFGVGGYVLCFCGFGVGGRSLCFFFCGLLKRTSL